MHIARLLGPLVVLGLLGGAEAWGDNPGPLPVPPQAEEAAAAGLPRLFVDGAPPVNLTHPEPYRPYQRRAPGGPHPISADEVAASLGGRGFTDVSVVRQRGRVYLCEATGPRGERVRLVVDARSGDISGMQVIGYSPHH